MSVRIEIVASHRFYREALEQVLGEQDGLTVVGTARSFDDAIDDVRRYEPDVVVVDASGPVGLQALRDITAAAPGVCPLAVGVPDWAPAVLACAEAGARGVVIDDAPLRELLGAIEAAARGEAVCSPRLAAALFVHHTCGGRSPEHSGGVRLTARETEVLVLIQEGCSNKEIAGRLSIALSTVKNHVHNVLEKLRVQRRWEAAQLTGGRHVGWGS